MSAPRAVAIGECMLELARPLRAGCLGDGWRLGFGGDVFNTAYYLGRLGVPVAFLSALGADPYSVEMRQAWADAGLDVSLVLTDPRRMPGLYAIRTDESGERSFSYWRSQSAARRMFELEGADRALDRARDADLLYFSGITLSILEPSHRDILLEIAHTVKARGGTVAFDPNYRPAGWPDRREAQHAMKQMAPALSIVLPTLSDERLLWESDDAAVSRGKWLEWGAEEVVIKDGASACRIWCGEESFSVPAANVAMVVDTTGAGDAFNAAYLAARVAGATCVAAAQAGHALAGEVIGKPGAIVDAGEGLLEPSVIR